MDQCPKTETEKLAMAQFPYRQILGKLNYYTCLIRADISFATNYLARFMSNPGMPHWTCLLHLLAYIRDTPYASITYGDPQRMTIYMRDRQYTMNQIVCTVM
jgi:hypothetical protein